MKKYTMFYEIGKMKTDNPGELPYATDVTRGKLALNARNKTEAKQKLWHHLEYTNIASDTHDWRRSEFI